MAKKAYKDEEGSMSKNELETVERSAKIVKGKIKKPDQQLPAWVQSKITKASDQISAVANYMQGTAVDEGVNMSSLNINKETHKSAQKQEKIRSLLTSPNPNEVNVAKNKLRPSAAVSLPKLKEETTLVNKILSEMGHCNKTPRGSHCPSHGNTECPGSKKKKTVKEHCGCEGDAVKDLEKGLKKLKDTSYESIDKLMRGIMKKYGMTAKQLHNSFVNEHNKTPDKWVADLNEGTASGDQGLRDWFGKSKSSDGKSGWVQLGGKYAGKPCARQPGQTSTPKCGSSKMAANLSPEEEEKARLRKNRQDPNQPEKTGGAKPTNVKTEEINLQEVKDKPSKGSGKKDACYNKVKSRYNVWPSAYASGALVKCRKVGASNWGTKSEEVSEEKESIEETVRIPAATGNILAIILSWKGKIYTIKMFFPQAKMPSRKDVIYEIQKIYPGCILRQYKVSTMGNGEPLIQVSNSKSKNYLLNNQTIGEEVELEESEKSEMSCNKPKAEAHGSGETGKSHVVKACSGGKEKLIRFGQLGVKGSPKKKGESKEYASRRHRFQTRHAKNIAKGKMSAAYWANKVKW